MHAALAALLWAESGGDSGQRLRAEAQWEARLCVCAVCAMCACVCVPCVCVCAVCV